jgi:hypothetical protein
MSDNDDEDKKNLPRITFIVRKDEEMTPEQEEKLRNRLAMLLGMYTEGQQEAAKLTHGQSKKRKKVVFQPYKSVPNPALNREELDD